MALRPDSEKQDINVPADYHADHPTEHPSDWGWHGEWGVTARIAGWIVAIIFVVMLTATHYNFAGGTFLIVAAASLVVALIWDQTRRRNQWRK